MTNPHDAAEPTIRCRRVDARYTVAEHQACPYCFGQASSVATGDHTTFCDYQPGKDPVHFGFPDDYLYPPTPPVAEPVEPVRIRCRRVEREYTVAEHANCPYCFGRSGAIATGDHRKFCDFQPGKDPITFGCPDDTSRATEA